MTGNELDRAGCKDTAFILGTEVGGVMIEVKMLATRDGPLDGEDKAHIQLARSELADTIFQSVKLAKELGLKDSLHDLFRMGKHKYDEKMAEYKELGRDWI